MKKRKSIGFPLKEPKIFLPPLNKSYITYVMYKKKYFYYKFNKEKNVSIYESQQKKNHCLWYLIYLSIFIVFMCGNMYLK
jgi:hypothetical protein